MLECPAWSVGELSREAGLEARAALLSLYFLHLTIFRLAAGKTVGPVEYDEKLSKSVVDAAVVERPAQSVGELMRSR